MCSSDLAEELDARLRQTPRALDAIHDAINRASAGEQWPEATRAAVSATQRDYQARFGSALRRLNIRLSHRPFNWERGAFDAEPRLALDGVIDLDTGRFERVDGEPPKEAP